MTVQLVLVINVS